MGAAFLYDGPAEARLPQGSVLRLGGDKRVYKWKHIRYNQERMITIRRLKNGNLA